MATHITTEEVKKLIDGGAGDYALVDVLSAQSYAGMHLPSAKNVPYAPGFAKAFVEALPLPKDARIVLYCASAGCQLSALAASALTDAGYTNVSHYADGLAGWKAAGYAFAGA